MLLKLLNCVLLAALVAQAQPLRIDPPAAPQSGMPFLTKGPDGVVHLSWIDWEASGGHALRFSRWNGKAWSAPEMIAAGKNWFVNFADFPALAVLPDGSMLAHWLVRASGGGKYGYGIKVARRAPDGRWREIHGISLDEQADYAGFLSFAPDVPGALYLAPPQGARPAVRGHEHGEEHIKTARYVAFRADGSVESDREVDADVCSCCQTSVARTDKGLIAAYRDHLPGEIRDIAVIRTRNGAWTKPQTLHADGWRINACPVEGPSIATHGSAVAIAWLTRAGDQPRVQLAISRDGGDSFGVPARIDDGNPLGRPALAPFEAGGYLAVWLEKKDERVDLRIRRIGAGGAVYPSRTVEAAPGGRGAGVPKLAVSGGQVIVAWRDGGVRAALLPVEAFAGKK